MPKIMKCVPTYFGLATVALTIWAVTLFAQNDTPEFRASSLPPQPQAQRLAPVPVQVDGKPVLVEPIVVPVPTTPGITPDKAEVMIMKWQAPILALLGLLSTVVTAVITMVFQIKKRWEAAEAESKARADRQDTRQQLTDAKVDAARPLQSSVQPAPAAPQLHEHHHVTETPPSQG